MYLRSCIVAPGLGLVASLLVARAAAAQSAGSERASSAEQPPLAPESEAAKDSGADEDDAEYGATAEVEAPPREPTRRSFKARDLARVPGVRGDAIRAVEILPGVSRSETFGATTPLIRGAAATESQVFLDGAPVPLLFHFGGITSFFQSRLLDRVELYPGNFSVRYGRVTGGVVEARPRDPRTDRLHGMLDLSVIDSAALVEVPISDQLAVAVAARRSNVDFFFKAFVPDDAYNVVAAPVYEDYQVIATYRPNARQRLRLMANGSRDSIKLLFSEPDESDPTLRGSVGGSVAFHHLNGTWDSRWSQDVKQTTSLTVGVQELDQKFGPLRQKLTAYELYGRSELSLRLSSAVSAQVGFDFFGQLADGRYVGSRPSGTDDTDPTGEESPSLSNTIRISRNDMKIIQPALYAELALRPDERVLLIPGVRVDYFDNAGAWSADPRLAARLAVSEHTTLKGGVGLFTQPPQWYEVLDGVGNPRLKPYRALQLAAGVEQSLGAGVDVGLEGFYKRAVDRVVGTEGGRPPYLVNAGTARMYGAELSVRVQPSTDTFGYLAYTLSRSERRDHDEAWTLWNTDQTHVLSAVAAQQLGRGWQVGARFRYVTGNPQTPITSAVYDARIDLYRPVYGAVNSQRERAFHQLDVRVEKRWQIADVTLAAYLELLNVYNAKNPAGYQYSYDYAKREAVNGLTFLPNIGVRGEL